MSHLMGVSHVVRVYIFLVWKILRAPNHVTRDWCVIGFNSTINVIGTATCVRSLSGFKDISCSKKKYMSEPRRSHSRQVKQSSVTAGIHIPSFETFPA
jgi:hypothetical protein